MRSTHTYALIEVPQELFDNVANQFRDLGSDYAHVFMRDDNAIDMHGYAITPENPKPKIDNNWKVVKFSAIRGQADDELIEDNLEMEYAQAVARGWTHDEKARYPGQPFRSRFVAVKRDYVLQKYPEFTESVNTAQWTHEDYARADAETIKEFARRYLGQDRAGTHTDVFVYGMAIGRKEYPYIKFREYSEAYFLINGGITIQERLLKGEVDTDWSKEQDDE